jgi:CubicO group peptidase (beta-lactamase class C family)
MRSATKSLAGVLAGIAMNDGAPFDAATPVLSLCPQYDSYARDDPRKQQITVEHLLTMTSGLACDDYSEDSPGNEDKMQGQEEQPDWYKFMFGLPMGANPGEQASYCSGGMNLVGAVISSITRAWLPDFFYQHIAAPLSFGRYHLQLTPTGHMYLGGGSYMRPRDFLKLGQMFLDGGRWGGNQIVSNEWVKRSLQRHSTLPGPDEYGYGWHLTTYRTSTRSYQAAEAVGNGGQILAIIPDLDLAVMFTGGNYGNYPTWSKFRDLVTEFLLPVSTKAGNRRLGAED